MVLCGFMNCCVILIEVISESYAITKSFDLFFLVLIFILSYHSSIMSAKAVSCTIKSAVGLQIGDAVSDSSRPGVYITDITLAEPVNVSISHISS